MLLLLPYFSKFQAKFFQLLENLTIQKMEDKKKKQNPNIIQMRLGNKDNPMQLILSGHDKSIQICFNSKDNKKDKATCSRHRQIWIPPPAKSTKRVKNCCLYKYPMNEIMFTVPDDGKFVLPQGLPFVIESNHLENFHATFYPQFADNARANGSFDSFANKKRVKESTFDEYSKQIRENYEKQCNMIKESEKLLQEHELKKTVISKYINSLKKNMEEISKSIKEMDEHEDNKSVTLTKSDKSIKVLNDINGYLNDMYENTVEIIPKTYVQPTEIYIPVENLIKKQIKREKKYKMRGKQKCHSEVPQTKLLSENTMIKLADSTRKSKILLDTALEQEVRINNLQKKYIQNAEALYEDQQRLLREVCQTLNTSSSSASSEDGVSENESSESQLKYEAIKDENNKTAQNDKFRKEATKLFKLNSMPDIANHIKNQKIAKKLALANFELEKLKKELQLTNSKLRHSSNPNIMNIEPVAKETDSGGKEDRSTPNVNKNRKLNFQEVIGSIIHNYSFSRNKKYEQKIFETKVTQKVKNSPPNLHDQRENFTKCFEEESLASLCNTQNALENLEETVERLIPQQHAGQSFNVEHHEENVTKPVNKTNTEDEQKIEYLTELKIKERDKDKSIVISSNEANTEHCQTPTKVTELNNLKSQAISDTFNDLESGTLPRILTTSQDSMSKYSVSKQDESISKEDKGKDMPTKETEKTKQGTTLRNRNISKIKSLPKLYNSNLLKQRDHTNFIKPTHKESTGFDIQGLEKKLEKYPLDESQDTSVQSEELKELVQPKNDYNGRLLNLKQRDSEHLKEHIDSPNWQQLSNDIPNFKNVLESTRISEIYFKTKQPKLVMQDAVSSEVNYVQPKKERIIHKKFDTSKQNSIDSEEMLESGTLSQMPSISQKSISVVHSQNGKNYEVDKYPKIQEHASKSSNNQWFLPDIYTGSSISTDSSESVQSGYLSEIPSITQEDTSSVQTENEKNSKLNNYIGSQLQNNKGFENQGFTPDIHKDSYLNNNKFDQIYNSSQNFVDDLVLGNVSHLTNDIEQITDKTSNALLTQHAKVNERNKKRKIRSNIFDHCHRHDKYGKQNFDTDADQIQDNSRDKQEADIDKIFSRSQDQWNPIYLPKNARGVRMYSADREDGMNGFKFRNINSMNPKMLLNRNFTYPQSFVSQSINQHGSYLPFQLQGQKNLSSNSSTFSLQKLPHQTLSEQPPKSESLYSRVNQYPIHKLPDWQMLDTNPQLRHSFAVIPGQQNYHKNYKFKPLVIPPYIKDSTLDTESPFGRYLHDASHSDFQKYKINMLYDEIMS